MKYRILFHSHVFVHKAHAVFFRLSEPRKVLIMANYPLIGMQFFRGPCFSRSAVHRQIAGDFETFAPVFLALVRLAGQDHAGSRGDREQEFRLTWSKTEASLIVEDRGTSLVSSFPVEFRIHILMLSACFVSLLREMTVSSVLPLLARTIANVD